MCSNVLQHKNTQNDVHATILRKAGVVMLGEGGAGRESEEEISHTPLSSEHKISCHYFNSPRMS